ncbi:MAG: hypothetical protein O2960_28415, partial [Verrucomicrobia bacterium]|nr:hypothetical protein [Verrucomicrobiota bacterium]
PRSSKSRQILQQRMLFMLAMAHMEHLGPLSFHGSRTIRIPTHKLCRLIVFDWPQGLRRFSAPAWIKARRRPDTPSPERNSPIPVSQAA